MLRGTENIAKKKGMMKNRTKNYKCVTKSGTACRVVVAAYFGNLHISERQ